MTAFSRRLHTVLSNATHNLRAWPIFFRGYKLSPSTSFYAIRVKMGSTKSVEEVVTPDDLELFVALQLTRPEIYKFYKRFQKYDMDKSGHINVVELLTLIDSERTHFTERVFKLFDQENTGRIDFREFLLSIWNYCTLSKASLELFTFDLYDEDGTGLLSSREVQNMLMGLYGSNFNRNPRARQIEKELASIDKTRDLNIEAFQIFVKTHHNLLWPAFILQLKLQRKVMGAAFWRSATERRIRLSKKHYVTMGELMQIHLHEDLYTRIVEKGDFHAGS